MVSPHRNSISTPYLQNNQNQNLNQNNLRAAHTPEKRPSLQETSLQVKMISFENLPIISSFIYQFSLQFLYFQQLQRTLQRTYSAPRDHFLGQSSNTNETTEPEINSRLESLCLRMTEQAIGGFGEA